MISRLSLVFVQTCLCITTARAPERFYRPAPETNTPIGFHGDLNATYPVGKIDEESSLLIKTTRECLDEAIKLCKPGALFRDLGKTMYEMLLQASSGLAHTAITDFWLIPENRSRAPQDAASCDNILVMGFITCSIRYQTSLITLRTRQWARCAKAW